MAHECAILATMVHDSLTTVLALLLASVLVVTAARRLGLSPVLGYLCVGLLVGPYALGVMTDTTQTRLLAEIGVVFLLFTLGLEFSWARMVAMRREVFGLGALQVTLTLTVFALIGRAMGMSWLVAITVGGALAMSSTAIVIRQLTEQAELNRTHGRLSFAILLFQDLAFVPLLALATAIAEGSTANGFSMAGILKALASGMAALLLMLLAGTEYRHQVEAVIRPFRELLLGLFFISVGMLLDVRLVASQFLLISAMVLGLVLLKVAAATLSVRPFVSTHFKALRTGMVLGGGGEFGVALLTLLLQSQAVSPAVIQPLLISIVATMLVASFGIRYNKSIARFLLREKGPPQRAIEREDAATGELARREHV